MFKWFKNNDSGKNPVVKSESKRLIEQYLSAKKEITYLEDKYDDFVLRSLEVEYDQYTKYVDQNYPSIPNEKLKNWMISEFEYNKITLTKLHDVGSDNISVHIKYSLSTYDKFEIEIESIYVYVGSNTVSLEKGKFKDIVSQYLMYWKLKEIEKSKDSKKKSFQKMVDIIGKDVKRDSLIDQILGK